MAQIDAFIQRPVRVVFLAQDEGENFALLAHLSYEVGAVRGVVPTGFCTDAASIPKWARWAVNKWGRHARACIVHAWLYTAHPDNIDRRTADWAFRVLLRRACNVGTLKAWALWACVRLGGYHAFHHPKPDHIWQGEY